MNDKKEGPEKEQPDQPTQQIEAYIVPTEIYEQMVRAIKHQPYDEVELLLATMKQLRPQAVTMQTPG